jgi:hypothetical protein
MQHQIRLLLAGIIAALGLFFAGTTPSSAGAIGPEFWIGGGAVNADYDAAPLAVFRPAVGIEFERHLSLGVGGQVDRVRFFYFAYAGLTLPSMGVLTPYGRFEMGRRDDTSDTAIGWAGGLKMGDEDGVAVFIEAHGFTPPWYSHGASFGITF